MEFDIKDRIIQAVLENKLPVFLGGVGGTSYFFIRNLRGYFCGKL